MGKRRGSRFPIEEVKLSIIPMIDIVFLMLIFFMCATKFRTTEGMIEAFLPKNRGQNAGTPSIDLNEVRIKLLWYDRDGRPTKAKAGRGGFCVLKVGDDVFNKVGAFEALPFPELSDVWPRLYRKLEEFKSSYSGSSEKGLPVIIDARKQVPTKFVMSTLNEIVRAGIQDVTFAAPEIAY